MVFVESTCEKMGVDTPNMKNMIKDRLILKRSLSTDPIICEFRYSAKLMIPVLFIVNLRIIYTRIKPGYSFACWYRAKVLDHSLQDMASGTGIVSFHSDPWLGIMSLSPYPWMCIISLPKPWYGLKFNLMGKP